MQYFNRISRWLIVTVLFLSALGLAACSGSSGGGSSPASASEQTGTPSTEETPVGYDLIIRNGRVIDPATGRDEIASVGIKDGMITDIVAGAAADLPQEGAVRVIDAGGLIVAPGFINTHTHEGSGPSSMQFYESGRAYVQDGITFWLGGNCGYSPTGTALRLPEFLDEAEKLALYNHYATLSGNISLRRNVGCEFGQEESAEQIEQMVEILKSDLAAGSFGVSFGAFYDPGTTTEAMIALAKASSMAGGMAASHIREIVFNLRNIIWPESLVPEELDEIYRMINLILFRDSLTEAIETCREADIPYLISHLTDMTYNGSTEWALDTVERAILCEGLPLAADVIGYDTFKNDFYALTRYGQIPVRLLMLFAGVKPEQFWMAEDVYVDGALYMAAYERLQDVSQAEELATAFKEGRASAGPDSDSASVAVWCNIVDPENTMLALKRPFVFMGNDGGVSRNSKTGAVDVQPRSYACFSRLLGHWSREEGALSLHEALFKATIAPAMWLGLERKGRLQAGCDADITIFDADTIIDRARPEEGQLDLPPVGIAYVIVNGQVVVEHGALAGATPGHVVRRTWQIPGNTRKVITLYQERFPG